MDRFRVGIVIPALDEAATISSIVQSVEIYGVPIVVDDGSSDRTAILAKQYGAVVVSHEKNRGYDAALNSGFNKAVELNLELVITIDADGQHNPSLIQDFIRVIDSGADVVLGIRSHRQRLAEHLFAWYTRSRFQIDDPLCGMKAYRMAVHKACGHFDSYLSIGTEMAIFAATNNYQLRQIPFTVREREGQSRFGWVILANYKILRAMIMSIWRFK